MFQFTFRFWYDTIVHNTNMTESVRNTNMSVIASTWLSEPYLHTKIFRDINTVFFTCIGWSTYYIVFKWSNLQPIIAGKRKRRALMNSDSMEEILNEVYENVVGKLESKINDPSVADDELKK